MTLIPQLLTLLRRAGNLFTPEPTLRLDLRIAVSPPPTAKEVSAALDKCKSNGWLISVSDEMTGEIKWRITESGKASLDERGL